MNDKNPNNLRKCIDYLVEKADVVSEAIVPKLDDYRFKYGNKLGNYLDKPKCPITGDCWTDSMIGIPIGERNGVEKYIYFSGRSLEIHSPEEIAEKALCEFYKVLISEISYGEKSQLEKGTKLYSKQEVLEKVPKWEFIEIKKTNGINYLCELEGKLDLLNGEEFQKYLHRPETKREVRERIKQEKEKRKEKAKIIAEGEKWRKKHKRITGGGCIDI